MTKALHLLEFWPLLAAVLGTALLLWWWARWRRFRRIARLRRIGQQAEAASLRCRDTRRQLCEYAAVFAVDGVLLVDMVGKRVQMVRFPDRSEPV